MLNYKKYKRVPVLHYPDREWPDKEIEHAPLWCSVDLRDGNQALIDPMNVEEKMEMFQLLLKLGFKQIEIGFPAASQIEYDFLRKLVDENMIPDDVQVQDAIASVPTWNRHADETQTGTVKLGECSYCNLLWRMD